MKISYWIPSLILTLTLVACTPDKAPSSNMGQILGQDQQGYAKVTPERALSFPGDHLAHPDYKIEWWYLTANLKTDTGEPLGLQWTQFRIAMTPPTKAKEAAKESLSANNDWASNQLYMAHAAVTTQKQHFTEEKWSRAHPKLSGIDSSPIAVYLDNWRWQSSSKESLFPATLNVDGANQEFSYQLQLTTDAPYQRQGENGYSIKSQDGQVASYYYSQPFIAITGKVNVDGKSVNVSGHGWLDREWSSQFLKQDQQGWDWFALRLDDMSTLMLFQLRGSQTFFSARRMFKDGSGYNYNSNEITLTPTQWHTLDDTRYPTSWQLELAKDNIKLQLSALNPKAKMSLTTQYWEGPIQVQGTYKGEGYMELTGY